MTQLSGKEKVALVNFWLVELWSDKINAQITLL